MIITLQVSGKGKVKKTVVAKTKKSMSGAKSGTRKSALVQTRPPAAQRLSKKKVVRKTKVKPTPVKKVRPSQEPGTVPDELKWLQEDPKDQLLSRFIETPKGTIVGESIGIEKSQLIIKNKLKFYSIPLKYVKEKDDKLVLRRKVDWIRAQKLGESWRKKALDLIPKATPGNRTKVKRKKSVRSK